MQTIISVSCSDGQSLRDKIGDDTKWLERFGLAVVRELKRGRAPGWTKLKSTRPDRDGAINVRWQASARQLVCRIVTRGKGDPSLIAGDLVAYLLRRHRKRIQVMTVVG